MKKLLLFLSVWIFLQDVFTQDSSSTFESTVETNESDAPKTTTVSIGYCPELLPFCSCLLSPIFIKCDNFNSLDQLDFSALKNGSIPRKIYELEIAPLNPLILDSSLNLDGIELYNDVKLRNLKGFELKEGKSNSFDSFRNLNLYLYNTSLVFYADSNNEVELDCSKTVNSSINGSIFMSFNLLQFEDISYSKLCPIVFKNVNLRLFTLNFMSEKGLSFENTDGFDDLNSTIETFRLFSSSNLVLNTFLLNKYVFSNLKTLDMDYAQLKNIEDETFKNLNKLKTILLVIENLKEFIQISNSTWMKYLNNEIDVDLTNQAQVESKKNDSFLLTVNNRNNGQSYLYPNEDLPYFTNWPHNKMAFYRILSDQNLNCTDTINFLLKYADNFKTPSQLSTTSTNGCFKPKTTPRPPITTPNVNGFCPELFPLCSCNLSPVFIKCENFISFDELDFRLLKNGTKYRDIYELELSPLKPLILDDTLNLEGIELTNDVKLRNLKGFELKSNPFKLNNNGSHLDLYLYDSSLDFYDDSKSETKLDCRSTLNTAITYPVFSSFNLMQFENVSSTFKLCPIIFKNTYLRLFTLNYQSENSLIFDETETFDDLNSNIDTFRLFSSNNLILSSTLLNKFVFSNLKTLDLDYVKLKSIEEDTFKSLPKLKTILIVIENIKEFIRSSNSTWMKSLNGDVNVDLNSVASIEKSKNDSLLLTMNNRNNGQSYLYPDEDLVFFENWPHNKMAFYRILSDQNLSCTNTLKFLLKYADNYKTPSTLSTTSTNGCYKPPPPATTTAPSNPTTPKLNSSSITPISLSSTRTYPESVSLTAFLATVIPLGVLTVLFSVLSIIFYCILRDLKSKILPADQFQLEPSKRN